MLNNITTKLMANKLKEKETIIIYAGLINALIDHIEADFRPSIFNRQSLKMKSNSVLDELLKIEQEIYKGDPSGEVTDQYLDAGKLMILFFRLGLEMTEMSETKSEGLNTQLNILLKNYGVNLEF
jgi:hypothetical protein